MTANTKAKQTKILREQSRRLHDAMAWLLRGFTLTDPRKSYPGFYLSPQQSYVLTVIHDAGSISPGDVARTLRLEKSHLTKIVNSLIDMDAVEKSTDSRDRRRLFLKLTSKGQKIFKELDKLSIDSYEALMKHVPGEKREEVVLVIEALLVAMQELRKELDEKMSKGG